MSKNNGIERLEGRGIKAKVVDNGKLYSSYKAFAVKVGYPDAADDDVFGTNKDKKSDAILGKTVDVLAKGDHGCTSDILYVVQDESGEQFIYGEEGIELIYPENISRMNDKELAEHIIDSLEELRRRAYFDGYNSRLGAGKIYGIFDAEVGRWTKREQQEKRDRIIEQAKEDVENQFFEGVGGVGKVVNGVTGHNTAEFVVDKEKRTVVALLRLAYVGGNVCRKGIAKCAPGDCFNVHIGKAISLRRALGLDVPDEYINAPQPTEVRVGDIIRWKTSYRNYRVDKHRKDERYNFTDMGSGQRFYGMEYHNIETLVNIIDDSREDEEIR